ncbi:MAG: arsenosugar biosynthesis radical SAM (seleno)protein ArsS [Bradymonadaceae bacterium]
MTPPKSLDGRDNDLAEPEHQLDLLDRYVGEEGTVPEFDRKMEEHGLNPLRPTELEILQINVGYMCNLTCNHCHVDAGPDRREVMTKETMRHCLDALDRSGAHTVDLTGGAPEMNPHFRWFVEEVSERDCKTIVRSNLVILVANEQFRELPAFFAEHGVEVIASLPCYTPERTDEQRGEGVFGKSIEALQALNEFGYGADDSDLDLHLVYNPVGPHLPPDQGDLEEDYERELGEEFGIVFDDLLTITNLPISRFLESLADSGKVEEYMETLVNAFNPTAAEGVMCRDTLSVGWDGQLYDCDFNQMLEVGLEEHAPAHIAEFDRAAVEGRIIQTGPHCYGCTAGAGSSCGGAIDT